MHVTIIFIYGRYNQTRSSVLLTVYKTKLKWKCAWAKNKKLICQGTIAAGTKKKISFSQSKFTDSDHKSKYFEYFFSCVRISSHLNFADKENIKNHKEN